MATLSLTLDPRQRAPVRDLWTAACPHRPGANATKSPSGTLPLENGRGSHDDSGGRSPSFCAAQPSFGELPGGVLSEPRNVVARSVARRHRGVLAADSDGDVGVTVKRPRDGRWFFFASYGSLARTARVTPFAAGRAAVHWPHHAGPHAPAVGRDAGRGDGDLRTLRR